MYDGLIAVSGSGNKQPCGMRPAALIAILVAGVCLCSGHARGATGDGGKFSLTVRVTMEEGKPREATPLALRDAAPPALTPTEKAVFDRAIARLFEDCTSEPEAVGVLAEAAPAKAFGRFVELYPKAKIQAKIAMAQVAAKSDRPQAVRLLVLGLMDGAKPTEGYPRHSVREAAAKTLKAWGKPIPVDAVLAACRTAPAPAVVAGLESVATEAGADRLPALRPFATHKHEDVRAKAIQVLAKIDPAATADLVRKGLTDPSPAVRKAALRAMHKAKLLKADDLLAALKGAEKDMTETVVELVPATSNPALRSLVATELKATAVARRERAVRALGRMGNAADLAVLTGLLGSDKDKKTRAAAARALGEHPAIADFAALLAAAKGLKEKERTVKEAAGTAFADAGPKGVRAALDKLTPKDNPAWDAFVKGFCQQDSPAPAPQTLIEIANRQGGPWDALTKACTKLTGAHKYALAGLILKLGGGDGEEQVKIIELLKKDGSPQARAVLVAACGYPNVLPRKHVGGNMEIVPTGGGGATLVFNTKYGNIWELLLGAVASADASVKTKANSALVKTARDALADKEAKIRAGAVTVLGRLDPLPNAAALLKAANDTDDDVRQAAARALGGLPLAQMRATLEKLAGDKVRSVRRGAAAAVAKAGSSELLPLAKKLAADKPWVSEEVFAYIAKQPKHCGEILPLAMDLLDHDSQEALVAALSALPAPEAANALGSVAVKAKDNELAVKAMQTLSEMAAVGKLTAAQLVSALRGVFGGKVALRRFVAACVAAGAGAPEGTGMLRKFEATPRLSGRLVQRISVGAVLRAAKAGEAPLSPERVHLVLSFAFTRGSETENMISRTYFFLSHLSAPREAARFGRGDRWPVASRHKLETSLDPALLALATRRDAKMGLALPRTAKSDRPDTRRTSLWASALRDDRKAVEAFLSDSNSAVAKDALAAVRLLGHRASIPALGPKVKTSMAAAITVVQIASAPEPSTKPPTPAAKGLTLDIGGGAKMKFVRVAAGKFLMGSATPAEQLARRYRTKAEHFKDERPQRTVTITKPFHIGVTEVTQAQWKAVMGTEPWKGNPYAQEDADSAASYVSWANATAFCAKLSRKLGRTVRLPTEAEWEYACRCGGKTPYGFGDDESKLGDYAWYDRNAWLAGRKYASQVAKKLPNTWGLHDMHGNVWEWCRDRYGEKHYSAGAAVDPAGPPSGTSRVLRGGSFRSYDGSCRSAQRGWDSPDCRWHTYGFRVILPPPSPGR